MSVKSPTGGLGRPALQQAEQVPSGFTDGAHLGDDRQVVDDKGHLALLLRRQVVGVSQQTEARHVCGGVSLVLVHQAGRCRGHRSPSESGQDFITTKENGLMNKTQAGTCSVQRGHGEHGLVVRLLNLLFGDDQLDLVPPFRLTRQKNKTNRQLSAWTQEPAPESNNSWWLSMLASRLHFTQSIFKRSREEIQF